MPAKTIWVRACFTVHARRTVRDSQGEGVGTKTWRTKAPISDGSQTRTAKLLVVDRGRGVEHKNEVNVCRCSFTGTGSTLSPTLVRGTGRGRRRWRWRWRCRGRWRRCGGCLGPVRDGAALEAGALRIEKTTPVV